MTLHYRAPGCERLVTAADDWWRSPPMAAIGEWRLTFARRTAPLPRRWVLALVQVRAGHVLQVWWVPLWRAS